MPKSLKNPTTFQQQLSILESKNIIVSDRIYGESFLSRTNYYRFSGYILPFLKELRSPNDSQITFEQIAGAYAFDDGFRSLLFPIIEKIEIYLRTQIAYYSAHHFGPDGYMDANNYNRKHNHVKFISLVSKAISDNNKSPVVKHHIITYGGKFPIWVIIDYFTLGMLSYFYTDMKNNDKSALASSLYGVNYQTVSSWLRCLTDLRNRCAHYSRLYYWKFPAIPKMPKGESFSPDRSLFSQIYMLKYLYPARNYWESDFVNPLSKLMKKYKNYISREHIGFPYKWKSMLLK